MIENVMIEDVTKVAEGIGDFGMMAVTAAFFLILAGGLMVACFKWFKSIINGIIADNKKTMDELLHETKKQNETPEKLPFFAVIHWEIPLFFK